MSRWHRGFFDSPFSSSGDFVPFSIFGDFADERFGLVTETMKELSGVDPRSDAMFAPFAAVIRDAETARLARAVAMSRAAEMLGQGDWYLSLARDVLVSGTHDVQPWYVGGLVLRAPRRAAARAVGLRVVADDIVSAVAVSEALRIDPESRQDLALLADFDLL